MISTTGFGSGRESGIMLDGTFGSLFPTSIVKSRIPSPKVASRSLLAMTLASGRRWSGSIVSGVQIMSKVINAFVKTRLKLS